MNKLLYLFELFLIFYPNAYYRPALDTGKPEIVMFCILVNIFFVVSLKYLINSFKKKA